MESEAQRKATLAYRRKNTRQLNVTLYPADADIAEWIDGKDSKAAYIKQLIRKDMELNKEK